VGSYSLGFGIPHPKEKLAFLTATKKPDSSSFRRARLTRFNLISLKRIRNQTLITQKPNKIKSMIKQMIAQLEAEDALGAIVK